MTLRAGLYFFINKGTSFIGIIEKYFYWIFESLCVMTYELVIGLHVVLLHSLVVTVFKCLVCNSIHMLDEGQWTETSLLFF